MMRVNLNDDFIESSQRRKCGILGRVRRTLTGEYYEGGMALPSTQSMFCSADESRIYYMYANMASLNAWRKGRGFSKSSVP